MHHVVKAASALSFCYVCGAVEMARALHCDDEFCAKHSTTADDRALVGQSSASVFGMAGIGRDLRLKTTCAAVLSSERHKATGTANISMLWQASTMLDRSSTRG